MEEIKIFYGFDCNFVVGRCQVKICVGVNKEERKVKTLKIAEGNNNILTCL